MLSLFVFLLVTPSFILEDNYEILEFTYLEVGDRKPLTFL